MFGLRDFFIYDVKNYCKPNVYIRSIKGAVQVYKKKRACPATQNKKKSSTSSPPSSLLSSRTSNPPSRQSSSQPSSASSSAPTSPQPSPPLSTSSSPPSQWFYFDYDVGGRCVICNELRPQSANQILGLKFTNKS